MATGQGILDRMKAMKDGGGATESIPTADGRGQFILIGGKVGIVNPNAGLIEQIVSKGLMATNLDQVGMSGARYHIALRLRDLFEGAQVKPMRSPVMSDAGGGGGGASASDIRGYQLDCMRKIGAMRKAVPGAWLVDFLDSVIRGDTWPGTPRIENDGLRLKVLHFAIDHAGAFMGYIDEPTVKRRWCHSQWEMDRQLARESRGRLRVARD